MTSSNTFFNSILEISSFGLGHFSHWLKTTLRSYGLFHLLVLLYAIFFREQARLPYQIGILTSAILAGEALVYSILTRTFVELQSSEKYLAFRWLHIFLERVQFGEQKDPAIVVCLPETQFFGSGYNKIRKEQSQELEAIYGYLIAQQYLNYLDTPDLTKENKRQKEELAALFRFLVFAIPFPAELGKPKYFPKEVLNERNRDLLYEGTHMPPLFEHCKLAAEFFLRGQK